MQTVSIKVFEGISDVEETTIVRNYGLFFVKKYQDISDISETVENAPNLTQSESFNGVYLA